MAKIVRYNGGTESYYGCTEPTALVVGRKYEVIAEKDRKWQTDYELEGVTGYFNSVWFNEVSSNEKAIYIAIAHEIPQVGRRCQCCKLEFVDGHPKLVGWMTTPVKEVSYMGNNIYNVVTCNSTYIVKVG